MTPRGKKVAFLDRDGTINAEVSFVRDVTGLVVLPGVVDALHRLHAADYEIVVVTNQSGIARGLYTEADLAHIHATLHERLHRLPRAYLHCPHLPDGGHGYGHACDCRKPAPGLLHEARELLGLQFAGGVLIGDSARDLLMGRGLPLTTIHVRSGKPAAEQRALLREAGMEPDHEAADLAAAVDWLLGA
ncbi:MAG: HAD-IIIA family hydrolase [Planctomycetes bacterium]|nr:HAD-IIIA family hydrolase [Planctomycetota bacterium]